MHYTLKELIEGKSGSTVDLEDLVAPSSQLDFFDEFTVLDYEMLNGKTIIKHALLTKRDFFYNDFLHNNFSIYDKDFVELVVENYENNKEWVGLVYRKNRNFASNEPHEIPEPIDLLLRLRGE